MKKQNKFTAKRLLALFMALAMCMSLFCTTAFAAEGDEGTTGSDSTPPSDSTATVKVEVTVDKDTPNDPSKTNVTVTDRPDVDSSKEETKEYKGEGTSGEGNGNVSATVEGSVTSKPDQDATETDPTHNNRVTHESGSIEGTEKDVITTPTEDVTTEDIEPEPVDPSDLELKGKDTPDADVSFNFDKDGKADETSKSKDVSADLDALVNALKPTAPAGEGWKSAEDQTSYSKTEGGFAEDGTGTKTDTTWKVENAENGWKTVEKVETVQKGVLTSTDLGWVAPDNATANEDGTYTVTTKGEPDANGVTITTVTIYNPASGTFEKTTTKTTETTVIFEETQNGSIVVSGVSVDIGDKNGDRGVITSLKPTDKVLLIGPTNQNGLVYKDEKWSYTSGAGWLQGHLMKPFSDKGTTGNDLKYTENAMRSSLFLNLANGEKLDGQATIRKMTASDGSVVYVYCAQHEVSDKKTVGYDIVNVNDANYFNLTEDQAKHIQYIAENGYWGTEKGVGSLDAVKGLLKDSSVDASRITDGIALAVTQAAIWYYGNNDGAKMFEKDGKLIDIFTQCYTKATPGGGHSLIGNLDSNEQTAAMALFKALIAKDTDVDKLDVNKTTDIISQEDIKGTSIDVVGKATEEEITKFVETMEKAKQEGKELSYTNEDLYKTDLSLTVAVVPDRISGEMTVIVYADGVKVAEQAMSQKSEDGKFGLANTSSYDKDTGKVTVNIPGVVLPEGVNITLNLSGTQNLTEGAYLFRSDIDYSESQTMVGYVGAGGAQRDVDLNVNMKFEVTDPTVEKNTTVKATQTVTEVRDWSWSQDWTKDYTYPSDPTTPTTPPTTPPDNPPDNPPTDVPDPDVPLVPGPEPEEPPVDIPDDNPPLVDVPEEQPPLVEVPDPDVPLVPATPEVEVPDPEVPLADIPDEDVPLADVPNTGDVTGLWCALGLVSCAGLAYFFLDEKKRQNNAK